MTTEISQQARRMPVGLATSVASYWVPRHLVLSAWLEHGPFAFWLVDAARPRSIVELGTHNGYSFFAFCQAVQSLGLQCSCYAVDTWQGDEHAGFYSDEIFQSVSAIQQQQYANIATLVRGTFQDALPYFPDGSIDLLHIDGRHTYDDVLADYTSWVPKLSRSGIVLLHDTNVRERDFGVWKLWTELKDRFPSFEFIHGNGLGVLAVGGEIPEQLRPLFDAAKNPEELSLVRAAYSRLGKACSQEYFSIADSKRSADQLHAVQQVAASHVAQIGVLQSSISQATVALSECQANLIKCESACAVATAENAALNGSLKAQRIATELQSRERFMLSKRVEAISAERELEHPLARKASTWTKAHPRRARWLLAGLKAGRLVATLQLGQLARLISNRLRAH